MRTLVGSVLVSVLMVVFPAAAQAAKAIPNTSLDTVVVYRDGVNAAAKAKALGAQPTFVYQYALSGFSARLTEAQANQAQRDRDTLMVGPSDPEALPPPHAAAGKTPIEQSTPQVVSRGIRRVGTLNSPTAAIDQQGPGVDADIAIFDGGVDIQQPDLNVRGGVGCNTDTGYDDAGYHGTMVAGVAAAVDNTFGVVGVAPGARLWAVRVLDQDGVGDNATLLCGLDWLVHNSDRIEVANMSLAGSGGNDNACGLSDHEPTHWAICHAVAAGVTIVVAAGNDAEDTSGVIPASYPEVITVSGLADSDGRPGGLGGPTCLGDGDETFAAFSNFGAAVDIAGPAECVGSTFPDGQTALDSGTSYAAPHVAGAAALYAAAHPGARPGQVKAAILANRERTGLPGDPDGIDEGVLNVSGF